MKVILIILVLLLLLPLVTLLKNQAPLFKSPGLLSRLPVYMTTNVAATAEAHAFPELRTPVFNASADALFSAVKAAVDTLGWQIHAIDVPNRRVEIVITTPIFRFKDDMVVQLQLIKADKTALNISSRSRLGRGDLAANAAHIQRLVDTIADNELRLLDQKTNAI